MLPGGELWGTRAFVVGWQQINTLMTSVVDSTFTTLQHVIAFWMHAGEENGLGA